jgi:hypothetical protein
MQVAHAGASASSGDWRLSLFFIILDAPEPNLLAPAPLAIRLRPLFMGQEERSHAVQKPVSLLLSALHGSSSRHKRRAVFCMIRPGVQWCIAVSLRAALSLLLRLVAAAWYHEIVEVSYQSADEITK